MDPISAQSVDLVRAVQALLVRQGSSVEGSIISAMLGQDVEMLLQALTPDGVKLQLPSGQVLTAQGQLPYPEGTQLTVRVTASDGGLRLQLQEARPPALPTVLAPLAQSEAQTLAARLVQENPSPELTPLLRLLAVVSDASTGAPLPTQAQVETALQNLPPALQASLRQVLATAAQASPSKAPGPQADLANALVLTVPVPASAASQAAQALAPTQAPVQPTLADAVLLLLKQLSPPAASPFAAREAPETGRDLASLFQQLAARSELPEAHQAALVTWMRALLKGAEAEPAPAQASRGGAAEPLPGKAAPVRSDGLPPALDREDFVSPKLAAALETHAGPKAALPETWESWIRGTVRTLSDPSASPREAPFHALQAREGTAFFELPVPWAAAGPLQIWVESDAPEDHQGRKDTTKRMLLGVRFTQLGETRLGMAQGAFGLQVRVWTEHPEPLEAQRRQIESELEALGKAVDLKIYALTYGADGTIPSVRSLVVGSSVNALG